eukprot:GILI01033196.1.p1 GENE.GILI01033196.1~~GILI01033196.1.p1  ORF type:complete len:137 (-),score=10.79 GILI01033196.1:96-506(-)
MSLVTQIYDGTSLPVAIHCAIEDPQDFNTNIDLPSRAAAERGVIPMPMKRASHVVWWRLHILLHRTTVLIPLPQGTDLPGVGGGDPSDRFEGPQRMDLTVATTRQRFELYKRANAPLPPIAVSISLNKNYLTKKFI